MIRSLSTKLISLLRDPIWQAIAVFVTLAASVVTIWASYDIYYHSNPRPAFSVWTGGTYDLFWKAGEIEDRLQVVYDSQEVKNLKGFSIILTASGTTAIKPSDYLEPIRIKIAETFDEADVEIVRSSPPDLELNLTMVATDTVEVSRTLFNPGDTATIRVTLVNPPEILEHPEIEVTGRVPNLSLSVEYSDLDSWIRYHEGSITVENAPKVAIVLAGVLVVVFLAVRLIDPFPPSALAVSAELLFALGVSVVFVYIGFGSGAPRWHTLPTLTLLLIVEWAVISVVIYGIRRWLFRRLGLIDSPVKQDN